MKTPLDIGFHLLSETPHSWSPSSSLRHSVRLMRLVAVLTRVPCYLPADRARRATQATGHFPLPVPRLTPHPNQPTLFNGHASVSHYALHVLLAHEERTLPRDHSHITSVALTAGARVYVEWCIIQNS